MRLLLVLLISLLAACAPESTVPTENVTDYEITYVSARASDSCGADLQAEAAGEAETWRDDAYKLIYRFYRLSDDVDGDGEADELSNEVEVYWRNQFTNDDDFIWFGQGLYQGDPDSGSFTYGARSFQEDRGGNSVYYDVEGRVTVRLTDELRNGVEDYIVVPPTNDGPHDFEVGCVYTLEYTGAICRDNDCGPEA